MSLDGVGLSLVNSKPDEVAYITLSRYLHTFLYTGICIHYLVQVTTYITLSR